MKLLFILAFAVFAYSDSYRTGTIIEVAYAQNDTIITFVNDRTKNSDKVSIKNVKERPVLKGQRVTVRSKPYKRHKELIFDMPVEGLVIPDVIE
jgi:hypothetical protein